MKSGCMPNTDFRYEEFEGLLGSFYLTLLPYKDVRDVLDKKYIETCFEILEGFASRHDVQSLEDCIKNPRSTESWGRPKVFGSCWSMMDMMGSFWRDFGVGYTNDIDGQERIRLARTLLLILERRKAIVVKYDTIDGVITPIGVLEQLPNFSKLLSEIWVVQLDMWQIRGEE